MVLYIMETKKKKATVTVLGIFVTALFIWLVIVGCNLYKNRWHKINFNVNSITVVRTEGDTPYDGIYNVTVKERQAHGFMISINISSTLCRLRRADIIPPSIKRPIPWL